MNFSRTVPSTRTSFFPMVSQSLRTKPSTSSGMSSGRSRSGTMWIVNTLNR